MTATSRSTRSQLAEELKQSVAGEVRFDRYARQMYSTDASIYKMTPLGVVMPYDSDDVSATIETCARAGVSVLPRGGGTGLVGADCQPWRRHRFLEIHARRYRDQW